jgi:hypothetical protein
LTRGGPFWYDERQTFFRGVSERAKAKEHSGEDPPESHVKIKDG